MNRRPGRLSARTKLTISYAGFLLVPVILILAVMWVFVLRWIPDDDPRSIKKTFGGVVLIIGLSRSDLMSGFAPAAAIAVAFLMLFGLVGGWFLAGRMLAPLTQVADAARMAANGSLSHRIRMKGPEDEFRELADVFDTMLEQLESHVGEQQRFAANASPELRTPLAVSQALLDAARNDPAPDHAELIERLRTVNSRAIDLTEALLLLSRADRRSFTREPVDLSLVAEEATETLLPLAEKRRITLNVAGETAKVAGSEALLLRMVGNLVQNAIVHNLPAGGTVTVHTETQQDAGVLRIENTGRPVPAELVPTLTEPFQRGTERVRTDEHAGVGLGLAIVRSIVRAHDGTLGLAPRPAGGILATVRLPGTRRAPEGERAAASSW